MHELTYEKTVAKPATPNNKTSKYTAVSGGSLGVSSI
jgi:hypothetical protein